jgi:uncharacterized protein (DUF1800 family)
MDTRAKVAHLLRRFGLGATRSELDRLTPLGVDAALEQILDPKDQAEGFDVSPWEFCFDEGSNEVYLDAFRTTLWWSLRLLMTQRPVEQKMSVFWHDHFAVSGDKVFLGPAMVDYLEVFRQHGLGKFPKLVEETCRTPAMVRYLDLDASLKNRPNENFSRELFELFTLGPGAYTEADIREASRAFTGWGVRYLLFEPGGEKVQETARDSMAKGIPLTAFAYSPALHDDGPKRTIGIEGRLSGEDVIKHAAARPETAKHLAGKLWAAFGSEEPDPKAQEYLARVWQREDGDIRSVLRAMAKMDEFWSPKAVRKVIKNPVDFLVPILRQFELNAIVMSLSGPRAPTKPAPKIFRDVSGLLWANLSRQGMALLFPPNVGGWPGGRAWVTTANMTARMTFGDQIFGVGQGEQPLAAYLGGLMLAKNPKTEAEAAEDFLDRFDADLNAKAVSATVEALKTNGGLDSLKAGPTASKSLAAMARIVFGHTEFQFS